MARISILQERSGGPHARIRVEVDEAADEEGVLGLGPHHPVRVGVNFLRQYDVEEAAAASRMRKILPEEEVKFCVPERRVLRGGCRVGPARRRMRRRPDL